MCRFEKSEEKNERYSQMLLQPLTQPTSHQTVILNVLQANCFFLTQLSVLLARLSCIHKFAIEINDLIVAKCRISKVSVKI